MDTLTGLLIDAVKARRFLYDTCHKDFKNIGKKTKAWKEISAELRIENGDSILKDKWKNLKDTYKKHRKSLAYGPECRLRNWVWASKMKFLEPFHNWGDIVIAVNDEPEKPEVSKQNASTSGYEDIIWTSKNVGVRRTIDTPTASPPKLAINREKNTPKRKIEDDSYNDKPTKQIKTTSIDLDRIDFLFLNYADTFKRLTLRRQALLKLDMANLFNDAELADMDEEQVKPKINFEYETDDTIDSSG